MKDWFSYQMEEWRYNPKQKFKDNDIIFYLLGGLILVLILYYGVIKGMIENADGDVIAQVEQAEVDSKDLRNYFSVIDLSVTDVAGTNNKKVEGKLYLKQPYIGKNDYVSKIKKYLEYIRWQNKDGKKQVTYIELKVFDRKFLADMGDKGVLPRDTVKWQLSEIPESVMKENDYTSESLSVNDDNMVKQESSEEVNTKKVDFDNDYELVSTFIPYKAKAEYPPLSNDEYKLLYKIKVYGLIDKKGDINGTTSSIKNAIDLFLFWEYGIDKDSLGEYSASYTDVQKQFELLDERNKEQLKIGNKSSLSLFRNQMEAQEYYKKMVLTNPRLVYYKESKKIAKTSLDAKKGLVELDEKFLDIYIDDAKSKLKLVNKTVTDESLEEYIYNGTVDGEDISAEVKKAEKDKEKESKEATQKASRTDGLLDTSNLQKLKEEADNEMGKGTGKDSKPVNEDKEEDSSAFSNGSVK